MLGSQHGVWRDMIAISNWSYDSESRLLTVEFTGQEISGKLLI
jgi:hypothetical protein